jgi:exodeoxyribonuclease V alpha subunit
MRRKTVPNRDAGFGQGCGRPPPALGQRFKARFLKTSTPSSIDGIEKHLGSGMIRGIGPTYAKKMVKAFGDKVFDVIEAQPDRLREVTSIGVVRAKRITDAWAEQKIVREIIVFLRACCMEVLSGASAR